MSRKTKIAYLVCIGVAVCAIMTLLILWACAAKTPKSGAQIPELPDKPDRETVYIKPDTILPTEVKIDTTVIADGLRDMGILITEEYYFTEVTDYTSTKKLFGLELGITKSGYMASYDGQVAAGLDFSGIMIEADEEKKILYVTLPSAKIQSVTIDPDSFILYYEKDGIGNHASISDFNTSLTEMKRNASEKAIKKGVLTRANDNAKALIGNFIRSLPDSTGYVIEFR